MNSSASRQLNFNQHQHQPHSSQVCFKCMCQICTCGKHKCPPPMKEYEPLMEKESYYKEQFRPQTTNLNKGIKQTYNQIKSKMISQVKLDHPDPGETYKTIQQENLQGSKKPSTLDLQLPEQNAKQKKLEEMSSNPLPSGEFQGISRQKLDYRQKKPEPTQCFRPNYKTSLWENESQTDYQTTYKSSNGNCKLQQVYGKPQVKQRFNQSDNILSDYMGQKFEAETTAQSQFFMKSPERVEPIIPTQQTPYAKESGKFSFDSAYRKQFQYVEQQKCPVLGLPKAPRAPSPGRNHLYYNEKMNSWE